MIMLGHRCDDDDVGVGNDDDLGENGGGSRRRDGTADSAFFGWCLGSARMCRADFLTVTSAGAWRSRRELDSQV